MSIPKHAMKKLPVVGRRQVRIEQSAMIKTPPASTDSCLPLLVQPSADGIDLAQWAAGNRDFIQAELLKHGAILFSGFGLKSAGEFERFVRTVSGSPLQYRERSSPRMLVGDGIYTSTEYPADHSIFPHNENSYQNTFPMKILFFCLTPASEGGETPIADCRRIFQRLDPTVREPFISKGVMYVRNYGDRCGLRWQDVFQTSDMREVEDYCTKNHIQVEWKEGGGLRTRQVRRAVAAHPVTGEMAWFNHATFFHPTTLDLGVRQPLLAEFEEEDLPNNTYYGDGSAIQDSVLEVLRDAYRQETVRFQWRQGDVLMLENMLTAHGRDPFSGDRKVLVGMAEPMNWSELEAPAADSHLSAFNRRLDEGGLPFGDAVDCNGLSG